MSAILSPVWEPITTEAAEADPREQEARIHQRQTDALLKALDSLKRYQDITYTPLNLLATGLGAGAALVGAGAALMGAMAAFLKWLG